MRICIVGAGASGLMCAGFLLKKGFEVSIFDGNEKIGKKLYITGKGRCNFTNASLGEEFENNIVNGKKFMMSSLSKWNSFDTINLFEDLGLRSKIERGNRAFPESDKSSDVIKILAKHCESVDLHLNEKILSIGKKEKFIVKTTNEKYEFDKVVIATGGKTYHLTGSEGDGYKFAKMFGHNITDIKPGLVPIELSDKFVKEIQGISLKNVTLKVLFDGKKHEEFGEMMFTDIGITGPIVLSVSSIINRAKDIKLAIDFKPALSDEKLNERLLREFDNSKNKDIMNVMKTLLPSNLCNIFLAKCSILSSKKVNSITVEERKKIVSTLKNFELSYKNLYPLDTGIITSGGVDLKEINPKTMESKLVEGLYFIGEVLDIDALTGGFNLQLAFSTAHACAENIE